MLVGLVAGFLASHLVAGHGYGLVGDIIVGILGALIGFLLIGDWLAIHVLAPLGIASASVLGQILIAFPSTRSGYVMWHQPLKLLGGKHACKRTFGL